MAVIGSYSDDKGFNVLNVKAMMSAIAEQSVDKLEELVQLNTPVDTGTLLASVKRGGITRPYTNWYRGHVESDDPVAGWVEYGTSPHMIEPRVKKALNTGAERPYAVVYHPGYEGAHMFSRSGMEFEQFHAERIAKRNARTFLGTRTTI